MKHQSLRGIVCILFFVTSSTLAVAQSFSNIRAQFFNGEIEITYDLVGDSDKSFKVELRSSFDQFAAPVQTATGAVGDGISPGTGLKIYWNPAIWLPEGYSGQLQFKLTGEPMVAGSGSDAVGFNYPVAGTKIKKGKQVTLEWRGTSGNYNLELYRFDSKLTSISVVGGSSYSWEVPTDLSPGKGYEMLLVNTSTNKEISSGEFTIGRKVPLGFIVAPVVVVGGVAAGLAGGGGDGNGNGNGGSGDALPAPPDPN